MRRSRAETLSVHRRTACSGHSAKEDITKLLDALSAQRILLDEASACDRLELVLRRIKDQRIVIVEDEVFIREALESYFKDQNEVLSFASAEDLLALENELRGTTVFIIDYKLSRMDGIELFQHLRLRFSKARYILITGEMSYEMAENTRKLGLDALMLKPFDFTNLENNISALVGAN